MDAEQLTRRVRGLVLFFVIALVVSGLTAVPIQWEIDVLQTMVGEGTWMERVFAPMAQWISFLHRGLTEISLKHSFIYYGTDWLAFAHVVIAVAFIGPLRDPVRNLWVIEFGMIACVLVIPTAMVFGPIRGIPFFWRLLDCSFGLFGILPLWICRRHVLQLAALQDGYSG